MKSPWEFWLQNFLGGEEHNEFGDQRVEISMLYQELGALCPLSISH